MEQLLHGTHTSVHQKNNIMRKTELIKIALIVFSIIIAVQGLNLLFQLLIFITSTASDPANPVTPFVAIGLIALTILVFLVAYLVFKYSGKITNKIVKDTDEEQIFFGLGFDEGLQISIVIIGLCTIIFKFPPFISSVISIVRDFIWNFDAYKQTIWQNAGLIFIYISGFLLVLYSKNIAIKLREKIK